MHVLFVESGLPSAVRLRKALCADAGILTHVVQMPADALRALDDGDHDVVLVAAPAEQNPWDGPAVYRSIAGRTPRVGLIVLSSTLALECKLAAFEAGADDYIDTSCDPAEITARARAVVRRAKVPVAANDTPVRDAGLVADRKTGLVTGPGGSVALTPTELRLLVLMADDRKHGVSTEALAVALLARGDTHARNLVHRHVSNLRKKLQRVGVVNAVSRRRDGYFLLTDLRTAS